MKNGKLLSASGESVTTKFTSVFSHINLLCQERLYLLHGDELLLLECEVNKLLKPSMQVKRHQKRTVSQFTENDGMVTEVIQPLSTPAEKDCLRRSQQQRRVNSSLTMFL